jgi:hypothetical protein
MYGSVCIFFISLLKECNSQFKFTYIHIIDLYLTFLMASSGIASVGVMVKRYLNLVNQVYI